MSNINLDGMDPLKINEAGMMNLIHTEIMNATAKNSFTREDTVNAAEAKATFCLWDVINPALFDPDEEGVMSKNKLSCYDNGIGMDKDTLVKCTDMSSSVNKNSGLHGHKGKGAKLSALRINKCGLYWISHKNGKTHLVKLFGVTQADGHGWWGRKEWTCIDQKNEREFTVNYKDITNLVKKNIKAGLLDKKLFGANSWTLKIYCGTDPKQETYKFPYGQKISTSWLYGELAMRFPCMDDLRKGNRVGEETFEIKFGDKLLTGYNRFKSLRPLFDVIKNGAKRGGYNFQWSCARIKSNADVIELGQEFPVFVNNDEVVVMYVHDPEAKDKKQSTHMADYIGRYGGENCGVTWSGVVFQDRDHNFPELYATETANAKWRFTAPKAGLQNGWKDIRVFVFVPDDGSYCNDENRIHLRRTVDVSGDKKTVELQDYAHLIKLARPEWLLEMMDKLAPKETFDDVSKELTDLLKGMGTKEPAKEIIGSGKKERKPQDDIIDDVDTEDTEDSVDPVDPVDPIYVPNNSKNKKRQLFADPDGTKSIVRKFPEIIPIKAENDVALDENFRHYAGQYLIDEHKLYINIDSDIIRQFIQAVKNDIDPLQEVDDHICKEIEEWAPKTLVRNYMGPGLCYAFHSRNLKGFKDDNKEYEYSISPKALTRMVFHWHQNWQQNKDYRYNKSKRWKDMLGTDVDHDNVLENLSKPLSAYDTFEEPA